MVAAVRKTSEEEDLRNSVPIPMDSNASKAKLKLAKSLPYSVATKALARKDLDRTSSSSSEEDDGEEDRKTTAEQARRSRLRRQARQISLDERRILQQVQNQQQQQQDGGDLAAGKSNMLQQEKKVSTTSIASSADNPFISLMGDAGRNRKASSEASSASGSVLSVLKQFNSVKEEAAVELQDIKIKVETEAVEEARPEDGEVVTTKPPLILTPRSGRRRNKRNSAEVLAARRKKTRARQAKLEKSGSKVFENYQNAISERRRSGDANVTDGTGTDADSSEDSATTTDDEVEDNADNVRTAGGLLTVADKRATMVRTRSWQHFDTRGATEKLAGTRGANNQSMDSASTATPMLTVHQPFSRQTRLRATFSSFGNKKQEQQVPQTGVAGAPGGFNSGSRRGSADSTGKDRKKIRARFQKLAKNLVGKK